jgi:hypothetical protein
MLTDTWSLTILQRYGLFVVVPFVTVQLWYNLKN